MGATQTKQGRKVSRADDGHVQTLVDWVQRQLESYLRLQAATAGQLATAFLVIVQKILQLIQ